MQRDCQGGGGCVSLNLREIQAGLRIQFWGSSIGRCYLIEIPIHAWIAKGLLALLRVPRFTDSPSLPRILLALPALAASS